MNMDPILNASLTVQIHLVVAITALVIGIVIWRRKRGTPSHKILGRVFISFMLLTAISAIFIRQINNGQFSLIHLFVPLTFLGTFQAVYWIRKRNIKKHISAVRGMFFGAFFDPWFFLIFTEPCHVACVFWLKRENQHFNLLNRIRQPPINTIRKG